MSTPAHHDRTSNLFSVLGARPRVARSLPEMARTLDKGDLGAVLERWPSLPPPPVSAPVSAPPIELAATL